MTRDESQSIRLVGDERDLVVWFGLDGDDGGLHIDVIKPTLIMKECFRLSRSEGERLAEFLLNWTRRAEEER